MLARAAQDAVWNRQQLANQLRSLLREYFPAALVAFQMKNVGLASREARAILAIAPTPARAAKLTRAKVVAALRKAGRERNLQPWADRLTPKQDRMSVGSSRPRTRTRCRLATPTGLIKGGTASRPALHLSAAMVIWGS